MKKLLVSMLLWGMASLCFAQQTPHSRFSVYEITNRYPAHLENTSRAYFDLGKGNMLLIGGSMAQIKAHANLDSLLALFQKDYAVLKPTLQESTASRTIRYVPQPDGSRSVELTQHPDTKERYQFSAKENEPTVVKTLQDTVLIMRQLSDKKQFLYDSKNLYFYFIVNNLDDIEDFIKNRPLNATINFAINQLDIYPHHELSDSENHFVYYGEYKEGLINKITKHINLSDKKEREEYMKAIGKDSLRVIGLKMKDAMNNLHQSFKETSSKTTTSTLTYQSDFIGKVSKRLSPYLAIHPSVGIGLVAERFCPNYQIDFSFVRSKQAYIGYTIGWRQMYFTGFDTPSGRNTTQISSFVQVGLSFYEAKRAADNTLKNTGHTWWGLYVGYQVGQNNEVFQPKTFSLSTVISPKNSLLKIQPEIYFTHGFKNVIPCIRLQFGI